MSHTSKQIVFLCALLVVLSTTLISIGHLYDFMVSVIIGYLCSALALLSMVAVAYESNPKH